MNQKRTLIDAFNILLILAIGFYLIGKIFRPGILLLYDHPMHFIEVNYLVSRFIPLKHWIDGWSMQAPLGQPILLYNYQLSGWLIAIIKFLFNTNVNFAYKLLVYASYVITPITLYVFVREKMGYLAGLFCGFLFLSQTIHTNLLLNCAWNGYFSIGLLIVFLLVLDKTYRKINIKTLAWLSMLVGLITLSHAFSQLETLILIFIYFAIILANSDFNKHYKIKSFSLFLVPVVGSFIAFYYLYNIFATRKWLVGFAEPWLAGTFYENLQIIAKSIFGGFDKYQNVLVNVFSNIPEAVMSIFGLIGLALFYIKKEKEYKDFYHALTLFILFNFLIFTGFWHNIPIIKDLALLKTLINHRFLVYIHLGLCIAAGYTVKCLIGYLKGRRIFYSVLIFSIGALSLLAVTLAEKYVIIDNGWTKTTESVRKVEDIKSVWSWISDNLDDAYRIVYQSTYNNWPDEAILNKSHVLALGMYFTPFKQIVHCGIGNYMPTYKISDTASGKLFGQKIDTLSGKEIKSKMAVYNAKYIVALEPALKNKISKIEGFRKIKDISNFSIYEYATLKGGWIDFSKNISAQSYKIKDFSEEQVNIIVNNFSDNNRMTLKVSYHPYWHTRINNLKVPLEKTPDGQMSIVLPEAGEYHVEFYYDSKKIVPIAVSIISFIVCIIALIYPIKYEKK